jgi:hypothetical protein
MIKNMFLVIILIQTISCLHFLLKEGKEKCIFDEIPKN